MTRLVQAPHVAREAELHRLVDVVLERPAVALVHGEAGVGKSRLVAELCRHPATASLRKLVGHCLPLRDPFPLSPLVELVQAAVRAPLCSGLGPVAGALVPMIPELGPLVARALSPLDDPRSDRYRAFRAIREVLVAVGPAICVLEDLHWRDEGTAEFLDYIVTDQPAELALVFTVRTEGQSSSHGVAPRFVPSTRTSHIELKALDAAGLERLVMGLLRTPDVSSEFIEFLHSQTGGVPFAVEEVLELLQDREEIVRIGDTWARRHLEDLAVPPGIGNPIRHRITLLPEDAQRVVRAAAVLEVPSSESLVLAVSGLSRDQGVSALSDAMTPGVLHEMAPGIVSFRHALARHAAYEAISGPIRRELHLRSARALERQPEPRPLAQIAHHFEQAQRRRDSARYFEAAADAGTAVGDHAGASTLLLNALSVGELERTARVRVARKLGDVALYSANHDPALAVLRQTMNDPGLPIGVRGEMRFLLARLLQDVGRCEEGFAEHSTAVEELAHDPVKAGRAMVNLAWPDVPCVGAVEHIAWLDLGLEVARDEAQPALTAAALTQRSTLLLLLGRPDALRSVGDIPAPDGSFDQELELVRGFHRMALAALVVGFPEDAEVFLDESERHRARLALARWEPWLGTVRAFAALARGDWTGLAAQASELADATRSTPPRWLWTQLVLGSVRHAQGERDEGHETLNRAFAEAGRMQAVLAHSQLAGALGRVLLTGGDWGAARSVTESSVVVLRQKDAWAWGGSVVPAAVRAQVLDGDTSAAVKLTQEFGRGLRGRRAPRAHAALDVCRAEIGLAKGDHRAAAGHYGTAAAKWHSLPALYEEACALEGRALALHAGGQQEDRGLLATLERFVALGCSSDADRVRAALRNFGIALPWRGGRRSFGVLLSPREAEVAVLAGRGRTNREIAATLFLSPRTVEDHVAAARRKLGVASRRELAISLQGQEAEGKDP